MTLTTSAAWPARHSPACSPTPPRPTGKRDDLCRDYWRTPWAIFCRRSAASFLPLTIRPAPDTRRAARRGALQESETTIIRAVGSHPPPRLVLFNGIGVDSRVYTYQRSLPVRLHSPEW